MRYEKGTTVFYQGNRTNRSGFGKVRDFRFGQYLIAMDDGRQIYASGIDSTYDSTAQNTFTLAKAAQEWHMDALLKMRELI